MPLETELKLTLQARDLPRLLAHPLLKNHPPQRQRLLNTYFDTPALALMEQRIAVRERRAGRRTLLTVKTAGTSVGGLSRRGEWEAPTTPGAFDFASLVDDQALAASLSQLAWQLVPVFRTDFVRRSWLLQHAGAQVELALDQGSISTGHTPGSPGGSLRQDLLELELELKSGPVDALLDLAHTLALGPGGRAATGVWLLPSDRSKAERGLALFLGHRPQPVKAAPVFLTPDQHPVQAFRVAALNCLAHLQAHVAGFLEIGTGNGLPDPEFIHQARVALRRLRTGLRLFGPALPVRFARHWRAQWKTIASQLGDARNWDVFATEGLPALLADDAADPQCLPLLHWVDEQRRAANARACEALRQPAFALDLLAFTRALLALEATSTGTHRARRPATLTRWALRHLRRQHASLLDEARASLRQGPEGRHALRIALKKQRYAQEFLSSLLPPRRVQRSVAMLTRAQTLLGTLNDLNTAHALLADCPLPARSQLQERLQQQLDSDLRALPRMERDLLRTRPPWD